MIIDFFDLNGYILNYIILRFLFFKLIFCFEYKLLFMKVRILFLYFVFLFLWKVEKLGIV